MEKIENKLKKEKSDLKKRIQALKDMRKIDINPS